MEHEDNNTQMENVKLQSEVDGGTGVYDVFDCTLNVDNAASIGNNHGKFEEGEHDHDEEWKYIKEGQQSEKQMKQQHNVNNDLFVTENVAEDIFIRNGNSGSAAFADLLVETGNSAMNFASKTDDIEKEMEKLKNIAFSNKSQAADDEINNVVEVKIKEMQQLPHEQYQLQQEQHQQQILNEMEEEEPSSLATNTTNGTNSLSENAPPSAPPLLLDQHNQDKFYEGFDNKENTDPIQAADFHLSSNDFDTDLHSQLNPNAREFVPNFGSNPASPTSSIPNKNFDDFQKQHETESTLFSMDQPHPTIVSRHLIDDDDDFVAESPRKGRCADMDAISLPAENEFEHEAAKRPHELEQTDDLIGDGGVLIQQQQQQKNLPLEELENSNKHENNLLIDSNAITANVEKYEEEEESKIQSAVNLIDHGPETSVDQDQDGDIMRRSIYIENNDKPIEDLLNTVQPLPIDTESLNNSSSEENINQNGAATKELLNVEEKEHISQSPSIEEFNMNLQNQMTDIYQENISHASQSTEEMKIHVEHDLHGSNKDIPQLPIDMDNSEHMESSFYIQNVAQTHSPTNELLTFDNANANAEDSVEVARNLNNSELQAVVTPTEKLFSQIDDAQELQSENIIKKSNFFNENNTVNNFDNFEQNFDDIQMKTNDGQLLQENEIVTINAENQFFVQETEKYNDIKDENLERQQLLQIEQENLKIENATTDLEAQINAIVPTLDILSKTENQLVEEPVKAETEAEIVTDDVATAVSVGAVAAIVAVGAVGAAATKAVKKTTSTTSATKKTTAGKSTSTNKIKENDTDIKKSAAKPNTAATKPRAVPSKPTTATDKKVTTVKASSSTTQTTASKKPLTSSVNVSKAAPKLAVSSATTKTTIAPKTGSSTNTTTRVSGPTLTRKTVGASAGATATATAKTRPSTAPSKPTTLAIPPAAKPKATSPRANLTTQLRKTAPSTTTAKSPTKGLTSTTNGVTSKTAIAPITNIRGKNAVSTTNTTTTTTAATATNAFKPFVARPAPKTTNLTVTTTTTTRRVTTKTTTSTGTTGNQITSTTSSTIQQKPSAVNLKKSPSNKLNTNTGTASGAGKLSTNKSPNVALKAKTKDTKTTTTKSSITTNPKTIEQKGSKLIEVETTTIESKINGDTQQQLPNENGVHSLIENGGNATNGNHLIYDQISPAVDVVADTSLIDA